MIAFDGCARCLRCGCLVVVALLALPRIAPGQDEPSFLARLPDAREEDWEEFQFDFTGSAQGWVPDSKTFKGIYAVAPSADANELLLGVALDNSRKPSSSASDEPDWSIGEAFTLLHGEVDWYRVNLWIPPLDTSGQAAPGVQLFVRDDSKTQRSFYSDWKNIGSDLAPGQWNSITLTPRPGGPRGTPKITAHFDPRRVFLLGIKIALNSAASANETLRGEFKLSGVTVRRRFARLPEQGRSVDLPAQEKELAPWRAGQPAPADDGVRRGPFSPHRPFFFTDPAWNSHAWDDDGISFSAGPDDRRHLAIEADFEVPPGAPTTYPGRKGYACLRFEPNLVLDRAYVEDNLLSMDVWCVPDRKSLKPRYPGPSDLTAQLCLYSRSSRRASEDAWLFSKPAYIGGPGKTRLQLVPSTDPAGTPDDAKTHQGWSDQENAAILYVGLSIYANSPWKGTICVDNVRLGGKPKRISSKIAGFAAAGREGFVLDNETFHVRGVNVSYLTQKTANVIDETLALLEQKGFNVVRAWGFSDGLAAGYGNEGYALHPSPYQYDPLSFEHLDLFLALAEKHGQRVILPLVNYWSDNQQKDRFENAFGGAGLYMRWAGIPLDYDENGWLINRHRFFTETKCRDCYRDYVRFLLNRRNTYTGQTYKDSPAIFAWELTNECRNEAPQQDRRRRADELNAWIGEMARFIKVDCGARQMVAVGDEGFLFQEGSDREGYDGSHGVDWEKNLQGDVSFGTVHAYPEDWGWTLDETEEWIREHCRIARKAGKPVLFEEFGIRDFSPRPQETGDDARNREREAFKAWRSYADARGGAAADAWAGFHGLHPTFRLGTGGTAADSDMLAHRRAVYSRWIEQIEAGGGGWCLWAVMGRQPDGQICSVPHDCDLFTLRVGVREEESLLDSVIQASRR